MFKLTYLVPLTDSSKPYQLVTVTHPQEIVIRELADGISRIGWKVRMWNRENSLMILPETNLLV